MTRTLRTSLLLPTLLLIHCLHAQCPGCTPDLACVSDPAFPTLCPSAPPDATAGVAYQADLTFWLPPTFTDPGTGFTVDFQQMTVTGVQGLPFGLSFQTNAPGSVYYPQENAFGCARVCGTPLTPGTFAVDIAVLASVNFNGLNIDVPQTFGLLLNVLPGSGGNTSFTYGPTAGCGSVTASFEALINGSPQHQHRRNSTSADLQHPGHPRHQPADHHQRTRAGHPYPHRRERQLVRRRGGARCSVRWLHGIA
jgi:hypothetical protein